MYDAIVLAGGSARRLGGAAKPQLLVGGVSLLDSVLAAVPGAGVVVVVGPEQPVGRPVVWRRESPAGGGPVAALAAGLDATAADRIVVLAADLPAVAPAVPRLLAAATAGVAVLVDADGRANHLAAVWNRAALATALAAVGDPAGASMRSLLAAVAVTPVEDAGGWGRDCDTWDDLEQARARAARSRGGTR